MSENRVASATVGHAISAGTASQQVTAPSPSLGRWQTVVIAVVGATVVNLVVWALGHLVGASFEIQDGGAVHTVDAMGVASSSAVPMAVGIGLAALLSLWKAWPLRVAQAVGAVFALATIAGSVSADTDGATMAALSVMHVVVALFVVGTLELLHRRVSEPAEQ